MFCRKRKLLIKMSEQLDRIQTDVAKLQGVETQLATLIQTLTAQNAALQQQIANGASADQLKTTADSLDATVQSFAGLIPAPAQS